MEKEISLTVVIGIVLIALAAVIVLSFSVFSIMKNTANEGVQQQQQVTTQFEDLSINSFNDTRVKGREVLSFINTAKQENYVVLINTTKMNKDNVVSKDKDCYVQIIGDKAYINYCSVLLNSKDNTESVKTLKGSPVSQMDIALFEERDGVYYTDTSFDLDSNGFIVTDYDLHNLNVDSAIEYISDNSDFDAHLVKDAAGVVIGICVEQINI